MTFFGFPKVQWLHMTDEVNKGVRCLCQIVRGFSVPKIIKIVKFLTELFKKLKSGRFLYIIYASHKLQLQKQEIKKR